MKKVFKFICLSVVVITSSNVQAQSTHISSENTTKTNTNLERVFVGGNLSAGFSKYAGGFGISPIVGYNVNKFFDIGANLSYSHSYNKDYYYDGSKSVQNNFGVGAFARAFPVDFLFVQTQLEQNFFNEKYRPNKNASYVKYNSSAPSLLVGGGLVSGRINRSSFFYFSVMVDVLRNKNSPYISKDGRMQPVFGAGVNIGLFNRARFEE
ncbi:MAG: hypothetical protein E6Q95_01315 [Chitinophagaceae bacterium]|nr:MAG: hypothetical protein E6Q95_01315 [Chitinophagaceae bacterium]